MQYLRFKGMSFFKAISTEEKARSLVWRTKFKGKNFVCPDCSCEGYYQFVSEPEIRKCMSCEKHVRLRVDTIFANSKLPMLTWLRAIYFVMSSKRGMSALELQDRLGIGSYRTALGMLKKIRHSIKERDEQYKLSKSIELDGTRIGRKIHNNQKEVIVAIETKPWTDKHGKRKERAGFAKVIVKNETRENLEQFISANIKPDTKIKTDAGKALRSVELKGIKFDSKIINAKQHNVDEWLPWVHRFISNAKSWIIGTHHGVGAKYLPLYLAEYTYRFNRRHDPDSLFHRAIYACTLAKPQTLGRLSA